MKNPFFLACIAVFIVGVIFFIELAISQLGGWKSAALIIWKKIIQ